MRSAVFWQHLSAAEFSPARSRAFLDGLGSSADEDAAAIKRYAGLSSTERKRLESLDLGLFEKALADGVEIWLDEDYPEPLAQAIPNIPPAIFVHGQADVLRGPTVGIVGTRNASSYGKACAQKFAEALAGAGATIVSGGALGIDAAAHRGALAVGGKTAAVLAGGVDNVYPSVHDALFRQIKVNGCLVSQFAVGARPSDYKFLARNVLIAALSQVLIVVQAPVRSGALSTAHASADLGREVFVVPANIDSIEFRGSFNLIRDGATLVYHPSQVIEALGLDQVVASAPVSEPSSLGERILSVLGVQPLDAERIVERTGIPAGDVLSELTMLELDGLVIRDSGGYLVKL